MPTWCYIVLSIPVLLVLVQLGIVVWGIVVLSKPKEKDE